jgi:ribosome-associated protein
MDAEVAKIELQDWLKLQRLVGSGGEAKVRIQGGDVRVNGELETRRRRKLVDGDRVEIDGQESIVSLPV